MFCEFQAPLCQVCNNPCFPTSTYSYVNKFSCVNCNFYYDICPELQCNGQLIPKVSNSPDNSSDVFVGCSNFNLQRCDYSSFDSSAKCLKCGNEDLVRRNRNRDNAPFIACKSYECDFITHLKNPIYKNSHLVSEYY